MAELLRCPFCNGTAREIYAVQDDGETSYSVMCVSCRVAIFRPRISEWDSYRTREEAIAAWNRRYDSDEDYGK